MNFNVNFNVLLSKYIVHPLVKIKRTLIISRCTVQPQKRREKYEYAIVQIGISNTLEVFPSISIVSYVSRNMYFLIFIN